MTPHTITRLIAAGMLFLALTRMPYEYYQILRWVVCGVSAYTAFLASEMALNGWMWLFIVIAIMFNPIVPVHMTRDAWAWIDATVALLIIVSIWKVRPLDEK